MLFGALGLVLALQLVVPALAQQEPTARDGRRLSSEPADTQALFVAVWGSRAAQEWVDEHNRAIGAAPAPAPAAAPAPAPAAAPAAAPAPIGLPPIVTITAPAKGQDISTFGGHTFNVTGTASDPGTGPGGIDRVEVWIFGQRGQPNATNLGTVRPTGTSGTWSVVLNPTKFASTHTNLYAYAHAANTNLESIATIDFNIIDRCIKAPDQDCPTT
jgi:hypothetical protein